MNPTFLIVPSLACQASCKYCFGPHNGVSMDIKTARETVRFVHEVAKECNMTEISVIFHGGEPLLASHEVLETLLEGLSKTPSGSSVRFSVQSNLWRLDDRFLELFRKYRVSLGTSLDGPKESCDENRGAGYYDRTMASIEKAEKRGMKAGVIATLTKRTVSQAQEILTFFRNLGINPVLHAAVRGMKSNSDLYALTSEEYADCIIRLYPWYVKNRKYFSVPTLDRYCSAVAQGDPHVCSLQDCLGMFLAISPTGDITPCQRMSGNSDFSLGNIFNQPSLATLMESKAAKQLSHRQHSVDERCKDCRWLRICRGGCYYNALSTGDGIIDPFCEAYKRIFAFLEKQLAEEVGSQENLDAIKKCLPGRDENPLLRSGPYISLAGKVHPSEVAENARNILAAYSLGKYKDINSAAEYMVQSRFSSDIGQTAEAFFVMKQRLEQRHTHFNNCYIHTTFRCNLCCTHCYARAGEGHEEMSVTDIRRLAEQALGMKFRQLVITGGEPLFHRGRAELIQLFRNLMGKGSNIVLRTNFTGSFNNKELIEIASSFDQVVVSIDGNEKTHDARRGKGSYQSVVSNCERYAALSKKLTFAGELSLACVMNAKEIKGPPGRSVRELGERLNVQRVRFRPLLPIGRAKDSDEKLFSECINQHEAIEDILYMPFTPMSSCGIGQNVYICPDGKAYPCYAWQTEASYLGNVVEDGLENVLDMSRFTGLRECTVDTIEKCRECKLRYLCGGACRAWGNSDEIDPNTAPPECSHLSRRAYELIGAAKKFLSV